MCYDYAFAKHLIFFGWNGLLMVLEHSAFGKMVGKLVAALNLPAPIRSHLVVLLSLPVAHLFVEDLVDSGYFSHLKLGIPLIVFERL